MFIAGQTQGLGEGIEEGKKIGHALGLEQGIEEAKKSAALECAVLKSTNEALQQRVSHLLEQSNGSATGQLIATQTATNFLVENQQLKNKVASLELTITAQTDELAATKRIVEEQAKELSTLRNSSAQLLGVHRTTASTLRPNGSPYLSRPNLQLSHQK